MSDADLKAIVMLTSEGLAQPIALQNDSAESNAQKARAFNDPKTWLENYNDWGRTGGHTASFGVPGVAGATAQAQVESYSSVGGAKKAFAAVRDFMTSGEAVLTYSNLGYTSPKIEVIDAATVGDDASAYRLEVTANGMQLDTFVIMFRQGPVLAQASVAAAADSSDPADVEAVANQMDGRIQSLLNGQPTTPQAN